MIDRLISFGELLESASRQIFDGKRKERAKVASAIFARVSMDYPASVASQSALIALECKANSYNPQDLGCALLFDSDEIDKLHEVTKSAHLAHGVATVVGRNRLINIIAHDFNLAQKMMILPDQQIGKVALMYQQFGIDNAQEHLKLVERMIWRQRLGLKN